MCQVSVGYFWLGEGNDLLYYKKTIDIKRPSDIMATYRCNENAEWVWNTISKKQCDGKYSKLKSTDLYFGEVICHVCLNKTYRYRSIFSDIIFHDKIFYCRGTFVDRYLYLCNGKRYELLPDSIWDNFLDLWKAEKQGWSYSWGLKFDNQVECEPPFPISEYNLNKLITKSIYELLKHNNVASMTDIKTSLLQEKYYEIINRDFNDVMRKGISRIDTNKVGELCEVLELLDICSHNSAKSPKHTNDDELCFTIKQNNVDKLLQFMTK